MFWFQKVLFYIIYPIQGWGGGKKRSPIKKKIFFLGNNYNKLKKIF